MIHPLLIVELETSSSSKGVDNTLVLSSPLGTTYRISLDKGSADNVRRVLAQEHALVATMIAERHQCDESCDDDDAPDDEPPRYPGNRISRN
jgi:hypothetical protein